MKVLLDENLDVRFKREFAGSDHEVFTVRELRWNGIKNGVFDEPDAGKRF